MEDLHSYIDQALQTDENYVIFAPLIINDIKDNQKEYSGSVLDSLFNTMSNDDETEFKRYQSIKALRDVALGVKGSFTGKLIKSKAYKYVVQTAKFESENKNPQKGTGVWGAVEDPYHAFMAHQMCLRIIAETCEKYGVDKKGRETTFKVNYMKLKQIGVDFEEIESDALYMKPSYEETPGNNQNTPSPDENPAPKDENILRVMQEVDSIKEYLISTLENDPNDELTHEPYEVIEKARNVLEMRELSDEDMVQIYNQGLSEEQLMKKIQEFSELKDFKDKFIIEYTNLVEDQSQYPRFKRNMIGFGEGVTPMPDEDEHEEETEEEEVEEEEESDGIHLEFNPPEEIERIPISNEDSERFIKPGSHKIDDILKKSEQDEPQNFGDLLDAEHDDFNPNNNIGGSGNDDGSPDGGFNLDGDEFLNDMKMAEANNQENGSGFGSGIDDHSGFGPIHGDQDDNPMKMDNDLDQGFGDLGSGFGEDRDDDADFDMNIDEGVENDNRKDFGFGNIPESSENLVNLEDDSANILAEDLIERQSQIEMEQESARLRQQEVERRQKEKLRHEREQEAELQATLKREEEERQLKIAQERARKEDEELRRIQEEHEEKKRLKKEQEEREQRELVMKVEQQVLEEKRLKKEEEERLEAKRKAEYERRKRLREEEEEEYEEEEEEQSEDENSPQNGYQRYIDRKDPQSSTFSNLNRRGSVALSALGIDHKEASENPLSGSKFSNANEDSQSPTKQTFPPVQDPYDKDSNINNNLELYQHQMRMPERNSVKIFQHPGDSSRNTIGNFKSEVNNTPMELYHHPLQIPNAKVSRNTISRENYSPEEVDELQALKKQNLELKNQVAGLRTTEQGDASTYEKLYRDNEDLRQSRNQLLTKLDQKDQEIKILQDQQPEGEKLAQVSKEYQSQINTLEQSNSQLNNDIADLKNQLIITEQKLLEKDKMVQGLNESYQNLKSLSDNKLEKYSSQEGDGDEGRKLRRLLEEMNSKLRDTQKERLNLEESLQIEKEKRLDLERQNNFLKVSNSQNQRDELEIERLRAEVSRLRNLASEYKDQAVFYGSNANMNRPSVAEQSLRQSNIQNQLPRTSQSMAILKPKISNGLVNSNGVMKLDLVPPQNMRMSNSAVKSSSQLDMRFSRTVNNFLTNNKELNWRKIKAIGKGDLYEDKNLRIQVNSKPIKLNTKDRLFYKLVFIFVNKSDFLTIENLSPSFMGHKSLKFMIKPNLRVVDIPPNSSFVLETISSPLKLPVKSVKLNLHYKVEGDSLVKEKSVKLPLSLISYMYPRRDLTNSQVLNFMNKMNLVGQNLRVFQPDPQILPDPDSLQRYFPHVCELMKGITGRKRSFVGFFDFLNRKTLIGVNFIFDLDTSLISLEGYANSGEEHLAEDVLQDILETFDTE